MELEPFTNPATVPVSATIPVSGTVSGPVPVPAPAPIWRHAVIDVTAERDATVSSRFEAVYLEEQTPMLRLATLLCGSPTHAHDIVQDAFANLLVKWDRVDQPGAYLRRSVVNGSLGRRRRRDREHLTDRPPTGADAPALDRVELADALAALPDRQRAAIVLRFYFGLPDADIAAALRCRVGTVASLVHRGLGQLRNSLDNPDHSNPDHPSEEQP